MIFGLQHWAGFYVNLSFPHLGASPEGIVSCACCGEGLLEIKCPYSKHDIRTCSSKEKGVLGAYWQWYEALKYSPVLLPDPGTDGRVWLATCIAILYAGQQEACIGKELSARKIQETSGVSARKKCTERWLNATKLPCHHFFLLPPLQCWSGWNGLLLKNLAQQIEKGG